MVLLRPTLPAIPILACYIAGILLYTISPPLQQEWAYAATLTLLATAFIISFYKATTTLAYPFRTFFLLSGCCGLGYLSAAQQDSWQDSSFIGHHLNHAESIRVQLEDNPAEKQKTYLLPGKITGYYQGDSLYPASGKVNVYIYRHDSIPFLLSGHTIILPQRLVRIQHSGNPYTFNFERYAAYQQLYFQGFYSYNDILRTDRNETGTLLQDLRAHLIHLLQLYIRDPTTRSVALAMLLNERALLHDDIWKAYAATGIIHIISISGMHIQVFLFLILFLLRWLKHPRYKWIKYTIALVLVWTYIFLTAAPPSAVRAGIMFSITTAALMGGKDESPLNSLAATAFLMLLIQPYWLFNIGMQLSFLCMLSIFTFYKPVRNLLFFRNKIARSLWEGVALSIAVQILVTPVVIYYFHQFPLWVILVNLPAGVYSFLLMTGGLSIMLLGNWIDMSWLGNFLTGITRRFNELVFFFAQYTPAAVSHFALDIISVILLTIVLLLWSRYLFISRARSLLLPVIFSSCVLMLDQYIITSALTSQDRLVVYRSSGYSLVQKVQGFSNYIYTTGSSDPEKEPLLHASSLQWGLRNKRLTMDHNTLFRWKQNAVLILGTAALRPQPVDILIISQDAALEPASWQTHFNPGMVVLDSSFSRRKSKKWVEVLNNYNFAVYSVTLQGALVLE